MCGQAIVGTSNCMRKSGYWSGLGIASYVSNRESQTMSFQLT